MALRSCSRCVAAAPVLAAMWLGGCGAPGDGAAPARAALPVDVAVVERHDVPLFVELVGSTLGNQDVPIRARVEGFLESMHFEEGSFVDAGDLLYAIDPQPFEARLVEAQSTLAAARTELARATSDLGRIRPLAEMDAVSRQDLDNAVAAEAAAQARVEAAEAGVELAQIELGYTRLVAPIDGLIGLTRARPGEFVGRDPNPVVLNVLSDIDPIRVRFSIAEREYLVLRRTYLESGRPQGAADLTLLLADGSEHPSRGSVVARAQAIDPTTGTYTVEAVFPNADGVVLPGQFARVRALYRNLSQVPLVPRKAVVELQGLFRVYVLEDDDTIAARQVRLGPVSGNMQVVEEGLTGGERVVVEGTQKVRPGDRVTPTVVQLPAPAGPPGNEL